MTTAPRGKIVDVHCHVHGAEFDEDREAVLGRATTAGVGLALAMGEGFLDNQRALEVARAHPTVLSCFGLHPDRAWTEPWEAVADQIRQHKTGLAAIGEVGLDYWVAKEPEQRRRQCEALEQLVVLALELDLPISVHSRSAGHQTIDLLVASGARRVCLHAFDGGAKHAVRASELGYYLSVPPSVVRSQQKQKLVRRVPLTALLLETDSPVLGPDPNARNEPANASVVAGEIARIKRCEPEEVLRVTTANAYRLFRLERFRAPST